MTTKTHETKRLILKPIDINDKAFIFKQFSNEIVNQYLFDAEPLSHEDEANCIIDFYRQPGPSQQERFIIILKDRPIPIGTLGYHALNHDDKTVDIGYDLYPVYHSFGYMREALTYLIDFIHLNFPGYAIHACIYKDNERSIHSVKHFGFTYFKNYSENFRGEDYEHHIYRLTPVE